MATIDAHCHASDVWYEPVETLLFQMDRHGVERAVLTQIIGQSDDSYMAECLKRYPDRLAGIGAGPAGAGWRDALDRLVSAGMTGVRLRAEARLDPADDDPLAIWREAGARGLVVSCIGTAAAFADPAFAALAAQLPGTTVALEHLGGVGRPDYDGRPETLDSVLALAIHPNVVLKVPSLGQLGKRTAMRRGAPSIAAETGAPILAALAAFGADRLMWGSDFPPVATREGYGSALSWTRDVVEAAAPAAVAPIFGGVANRLFFPAESL